VLNALEKSRQPGKPSIAHSVTSVWPGWVDDPRSDAEDAL